MGCQGAGSGVEIARPELGVVWAKQPVKLRTVAPQPESFDDKKMDKIKKAKSNGININTSVLGGTVLYVGLGLRPRHIIQRRDSGTPTISSSESQTTAR